MPLPQAAKLKAHRQPVVTEIFSAYAGGLRCQSRHGPSDSLLDTDAPTDNQGRGERFSPTDLVATALSTCMLTIMGIVAERHGWVLEGCTARVEKTMSSAAPRRIAQLTVWVQLPPDLDPAQRALLQRAAETCPVKVSLEGAIPMRIHWS